VALRREELAYRGFFTPLRSASTFQQALLAAEPILSSEEFGESDDVKVCLLETLLSSPGKPNDSAACVEDRPELWRRFADCSTTFHRWRAIRHCSTCGLR
jgi:hypothetical protein